MQNAALRTATGAHKMASIDHLHQESLTLKVKDHSDILSAQYLVNCLEEDHVCHGITTKEPRPRPMKEISLNSVPIEQVNHTKFLGVVIDNKLDWSNHISYINAKIAIICIALIHV